MNNIHAKGSSSASGYAKGSSSASGYGTWRDVHASRLTGHSSAASTSSCVRVFPEERRLVSSLQYATNQLHLSPDWRKHPRIAFLRDYIRRTIFATFSSLVPHEQVQNVSYMATIVEYGLFMEASSEEEYMKEKTLNLRVISQLNKFSEGKLVQQVDTSKASTSNMVQSSSSLHAWSNGTLLESPSQNFADPIINTTNYCAPVISNTSSASDDHKMSFIKSMHLTGCSNEMCTGEQSMKLPVHTDNCQSNDCHIRRCQKLYHATGNPKPRSEFESSVIMDSIVRDNGNDAPFDKDVTILPLTKRRKVDPAFNESLHNNASSGLWTQKMVHPYFSKEIPELQQQAESPFSFFNVEGHTNLLLDPMDKSERKNNVIDDTLGQTFESEALPSQDLEANHISEESVPKSHNGIASSNLKENVIGLKSSIHTFCIDPIDAEIEDIHCTTEFNSARENAEKTDIELKADEEKKTKYSNTTVNHISEGLDPKIHDVMASSNLEENVISLNCTMDTLFKDPTDADMEDVHGIAELNHAGENVKEADTELKANQKKKTKSSTEKVNVVALTEFFTLDQLRKHISDLEGPNEKERGSAADSCQLCRKQKLIFAPVPIYCSMCSKRIKRNAAYYLREAEESDTQHFFCTSCYKNFRGDIKFNETSFAKKLLVKMTNNDESEEAWVECNKCKGWQHQICALYNSNRDVDCSGVYICPRCRMKDIENGKHVPLPKTANFGAKDLPRTKLSDHIENRLFKRLMKERADTAKVERKNNPDEVLAAENLSVRVVLSVDKQLKVKKEFLDIFSDENYPSEFLYRSKNIEGVDVCLFGMYVQEFGSECGLPNQRCVYISFLDSCKYFRPDRKTATGEALRTYVYHEILIGYLDYCKKRGFTTCYLYACPPIKGEDYILYCRPDNQKIPNDDRLRRWYHSMLRKASEENIVVGLTNMYDHFFVPTSKCNSKITAASLPYFDGDYWSAKAVELAQQVEQESGGYYEKQLKTLRLTERSLKAMGHRNPSKDTAKDILVMQKLGEFISSSPNNKEDFIVIHLQHACMHCHEVIASGKRWFCTECKNFQECDRCHTADSHSSINGEKHTLCQALIDDIPFDTKENDIILDNEFLENRITFLSFCQNQKNKFQFDTPRRAKYSTMMIIDQLYAQHVIRREVLIDHADAAKTGSYAVIGHKELILE
ncbi:hypothetical protein RIF29_19396 [Crotalaria pallida]|uniref:histone acetyltransferase n=1 Tax=Crotalaria pallida TaxID=3830 RepID=A0AAN9F3E2_CROPI